jgi:hypothetical protein
LTTRLVRKAFIYAAVTVIVSAITGFILRVYRFCHADHRITVFGADIEPACFTSIVHGELATKP